MPGVPSGRACEGCRKQKKKCDEVQPSCARCTRLRITCVGSGQRKFIFKPQEHVVCGLDESQSKAISLRPSNVKVPVVKMTRKPSNEVDLLVGSFVQTMKPSTDLRFNLVWTFGYFLIDVPPRLGRNEALDVTVSALVTAHSNFCTHSGIGVAALNKYSQALKVLRVYLDDPVKARQVETLCAVMLMLICQNFIGTNGLKWTGHVEGAAQILKARGYYDPKDEFESKLMLTLRGPMLFEGLMNPNFSFTPQEWERLIENKLDITQQSNGRGLLRGLARVPGYLRRGRKVISESARDTKLVSEIRNDYEGYQKYLKEAYGRLVTTQELATKQTNIPRLLRYSHAQEQRVYVLYLIINCIFNCILRALEPDNIRLRSESTFYALEILSLSKQSHVHRPLGSSYMLLALMAAWLCVIDDATKSKILAEFAEYRSDYSTWCEQLGAEDLDKVYRHLSLLEPMAA